MSINQLPNNELSIEIDMRDLLRAKKEKLSNEPERAVHDFSETVFRISVDPFRRSTTSSKSLRGYARN